MKQLLENMLKQDINEWSLLSLASPETVAKIINKLLYKMDVASIDFDSLVDKIKDLTDKAKVSLLQAIRDKEVNVILSILGLHPSKKLGIV